MFSLFDGELISIYVFTLEWHFIAFWLMFPSSILHII